MVNSRKDYICISVLFAVNLLNYVDRYTVAGVLTKVQGYFVPEIDDSEAGLIQTVFLIAFMLFSPVCGYLGDRFNRKLIMMVGVSIWLGAVLASTFVPKNHFWMFLLFRGLVGIGEASYSNLAPSIISDMFNGTRRSHVFMLFYFAVPVGSGLGFIVGSNVASLTGQWQWGVRVTALAGVVVLALMVFLVFEPERGAADRVAGTTTIVEKSENYWSDIKSLLRIPTFISCTWGYTALVFVAGSLAWWEPTVIEHSIAWSKGLNDTADLDSATSTQVGLIFGMILMIAGLFGVIIGTIVSGWIIKGTGPFRIIQTARAQPLVCTFGSLIGSPLLFCVFFFGHRGLLLIWILLFFTNLCLCLNWGLNVDIVASVVSPARRSTAFAYLTLTSHLFGDATGPYIIGKVSDTFRKGSDLPKDQYHSLIKASYICVALLIVSAILYFLSSLTILQDQKKFKQQLGISPLDSVTKPIKTSTDSLEKVGLDEITKF